MEYISNMAMFGMTAEARVCLSWSTEFLGVETKCQLVGMGYFLFGVRLRAVK